MVEITLLQFNDVYEIGPVEGGKSGGLARVATLRQRLLAENPNTFTVLAGDFVSPSALGTAKVDGQSLAGQQMVAVLNAVGLDLATFGNHEFDIKEASAPGPARRIALPLDLGQRDAGERRRPFPGVPPARRSLTAQGPGGSVRIGFVGVTLGQQSGPLRHLRRLDRVASAARPRRCGGRWTFWWA